MRTLEQIAIYHASRLAEFFDLKQSGEDELRESIEDALREMSTAVHEGLYQKVVNRISADIAGDFELALDQLESNVRAARDAEFREAVEDLSAQYSDAQGPIDMAFSLMLKWLDSRKDQA